MVESKSLSVMVMNRDTSGSDDLLGTCKVALWEAIPNKVVCLTKILDHNQNVANTLYQGAQEDVPSKGEVACSFLYSTDRETLTVHVTKATITEAHKNSTCYIKCSLDDGQTRQKKKSRVVPSSPSSPFHLTFDEDMVFQVSINKLTHCKLNIEVWTTRYLLVPSTCIGDTVLQTMPLWMEWLKDRNQSLSSVYTLQ